jgi:V/A-type H+-transporting ATPase subunit D
MSVPATRMNLLATRQKMVLANEGVNLLKSKREALIEDFFRTADTIMDSREEIGKMVLKAMVLGGTARSWAGSHQVKAAAAASRTDIPISTREVSIWGIRIPVIELGTLRKTSGARGLSPVDTPVQVLEMADSYEELLERLLRTASQEIRLKRLGEEIRKVNRRINALEQSLIPTLRAQAVKIGETLEEREREDIFRLKHIKNRRARSFGK